MKKKEIIVVTGSAGFIGSCLVGFLNKEGFENLLLVDDFSAEAKQNNLKNKKYLERIDREFFFDWLATFNDKISCFIHLGAKTDTTEFDYRVHEYFNVEYSERVWKYCTDKNIPLIYASSAATYGANEQEFNDDHTKVFGLKPLNPYGISKNEFDKWALKQEKTPSKWIGLKFFNVYGPNEYHKGKMASMVYHAFNQINHSGTVQLFKSCHPGFSDGQQVRDFIYVKDILKVIYWLMINDSAGNGLYNLGTGNARSFKDLTESTFESIARHPNIKYIEMPVNMQDKYQYYTKADMRKLGAAGYKDRFYTVEEGVKDYVENYLIPGEYY
ncbi:ADP-glyceromanno-heptose 6-epimerase [Pedobacter cryoconitis]|uniref:ADP-glyceromanno-heptose 6-epimerase n=1 Tax=Pedobacter cryoconitis TaxID=188932 RepID=A0A127VEK2_9SPHI|nr:ADP-glyceromanno-heptose 6-epimerase [Pedobacter cryoconitis]AMP99719.1 ADP-glyceromanno-heptose 6-epimerase [Pedobacter cryoconitis]